MQKYSGHYIFSQRTVIKVKKAERTRAKLIASAGRSFRKAGYAGVGVDSIAQEAGVTSGAFYAHLRSKDGAFQSALLAGLGDVLTALPKFREDFGEDWPEAFAKYYLGDAHRNDIENGCAMAGLSPDVVRAQPDVQHEYAGLMRQIAGEIVKGIPGKSPESAKQQKAWAFLASLIGALIVARAAGSEPLAEEIAEASRSAAVAAFRADD